MSLVSKSIKSLCTPGHVAKRLAARAMPTTTACADSPIISQSTPTRYLSTSATNSNTSDTESKNSTASGIFSKVSSSILNIKSQYSITSQQNRIQQASNLFEAIRHQAHDSQWYIEKPSDENIKIKANFRNVHALLSMHVWFVHRRLYAENKNLDDHDTKKHDNLLLQEELFEFLWTDTQCRIRAQGVNELTVNKHLKDAQRATFLHCTQYDHAYAEHPNDVEKRFEVICDAVWKHVLGGEEDCDDELIRKIGAYVEYQMLNVVKKLPDDYFNEGRIAWGNIPEMESDSKGNANDDFDSDEKLEEKRGMTFLKNGWVQILTDAGNPYYWNMETNETKWDKP